MNKKTPNQLNRKTPESGSKMNKKMDKAEIFASCSFSSLGLDSTLCDQLRERLGFEVPTQVQAQAIPVILSGRHVLVNASTGSGKTVAYLAPVIHHLSKYSPRVERSDGTLGLVIVPTRELCLQVYEILQKLLHRFHWIVPGYVMGGEKIPKEKARLRKGISILIATPGRLLYHLKNTNAFVHSKLRWVIFDEADRTLELGFEKDIKEILDLLGSSKDEHTSKGNSVASKCDFERQNLLLSATLNDKVNHLVKMSLENPVLIGLDEKKMNSASHLYLGDDSERQLSTTHSSPQEYSLPSQLSQKYVKVPCNARLAVLVSILKYLYDKEASQKIVVFFSTCDAVDFHYTLLSEFQFTPFLNSEVELKQLFIKCKMFRLHGNMDQKDRKEAFQSFKTDKCALLLSTDVSARGLDFPKVRCIIQYDSPGEATEYVHRVGRTARLGEIGDSLLFLQPVEADYLKDLEKHGVALTEFPLYNVLKHFPHHSEKHQARKFISVESHPWVMTLQKALEGFISSKATAKSLGEQAFWSWVRAYTAHRGDLKRIFMKKNLHLGHVAKSFALKDQPSLVVKSFQRETKKRERDVKHKELINKRKINDKNKKEALKKRKLSALSRRDGLPVQLPGPPGLSLNTHSYQKKKRKLSG